MKTRAIFFSILIAATAIIFVATNETEFLTPVVIIQGFMGLFSLLDDINDTLKKR